MTKTPPPSGLLTSDSEPLLILLQLESLAWQVQDPLAMPFLIVNETRRLFNYRQAILFKATEKPAKPMQVEAISSIAVVDRNVPMVQWLEKLLADLYNAEQKTGARRFFAQDVSHADLQAGWREFSLPYIAWAPFYLPAGQAIGGLWLARETPWEDNELVLLNRLCEAYSHAWHALPKSAGKAIVPKFAIKYGVLALLACLAIPVRLSALAPVEVVPEKPMVVTSPLDGVIAEVYVDPNSPVHAGQALLRFEDTVLRKDSEVAERSLAIAKADHLRAMQGAFGDDKNKSEMALLKSKVDLAEAERAYAQDVLNKVEVVTTSDGVAVFGDVSDWQGKPVKTGEKIMEIANPKHIALRLNLPVKGAIALPEGAEVKAFFDADPLHPLAAVVSDVSYQAEVLPGDLLAYRINAHWQGQALPEGIRIGWRGTAKVYGQRVPLLYYLLRRPVSAVRQYLGL